MLDAYREGNQIWIPKRAEGHDGTIGDGWALLSPGDPGYTQWDEYLRRSDPLNRRLDGQLQG